MGLTAPHLKYILRIKKRGHLKGPILTLGNQDVYTTERSLTAWLQKENISFSKPKKVFYSESKGMKEINKESDNFLHAMTFFEFLGIPLNKYYDIDKFNFDKPKILHDLEKPISSKYYNFFNFIIDGCTLTHILDVKSVLFNIVKMTRIGGYVLHINPAQNFLNHGFYQFSPTFFYDFYSNNGFEIVESYLIEVKSNTYRFHTYNQKDHYLGIFFSPKNRIVNCFLVRKRHNVKHVLSPNQYIYEQLSKVPKKVKKDWEKTDLDKIVSLFRNLIPIKLHGLFFNLWTGVKRLNQKTTYFDINP